MAEESLVTEEMRKVICGLVNIAVTEIEKGTVKRFCKVTGDTNSLWQDEEKAKKTSYGGTIVPPKYFITMQMEGESPGFYMPYQLSLKVDDKR